MAVLTSILDGIIWICAVVGLWGSSSSMWLLGHNKVFAPSQGGPSPPSSVTSLDNSPHFKPGSTPGQLCSSRKQLLGHIWSLLSNICPLVSKTLFSIIRFLAWCIFDSKPKHWLVSSEQGKYLEQRAPQKPSSLHQITLTAPKLQGKGFIQNSILAYVHFIPTK